LRMQHSTAYRMEWAGAAGGTFSDAAEWLDGSETSFRDGTAPRAHDTAIFDAGSITGYDVDFAGDTTINGLIVGNDNVALELGARSTLTLTSASSVHPGVVLGENDGDDALLTLAAGTVVSEFVHVGVADGTTAELTVGADAMLQADHLVIGPGGRIVLAARSSPDAFVFDSITFLDFPPPLSDGKPPATPEPTTMLLLCVAVGPLLRRRRKRARRTP